MTLTGTPTNISTHTPPGTVHGTDAKWRDVDRRSTAVVLSLFDTGLAAVRSLGRAGIPVIGLDPDDRMPGFRSRYCAARVCPDPVTRPDDLAEVLVQLGRRLDRPGILFPASDAFVLFCSRYRDELGRYFRLALPSAATLEAILDKRAQYELARRFGIPFPETHYPDTLADVERIKTQIAYPAFVKAYYAHLWRTHFDSKGFRVDSPEELTASFRLVLEAGVQAMVQSVIPGPPTNNYEVSFYVTSQGEVPAYFTVRKLRQYPTDFGVGTMVETVRDVRLAALARDLVERLDYRGFGNLEFKLDPRDGQLKLIELNARLWQQNDQAAACGINFPLLQYLDLTGQPLPPVPSAPAGVKWVDPLADFQSFWAHYRRREITIGDWMGSWHGVRAYAAFARDDPSPGLASVDYGRKLLRLPLYILKHRVATTQENG